MRITYIHQYFNTPEHGGGTRSYEFARRLVEAGHKVNMITSDPRAQDGCFRVEKLDVGINIHWLPVAYDNKMSFSKRLRSFFAFSFAARKIARNIPADLIFATSTPLTVSIPAVAAKKRHKIPMVFEVRDLWPEIPIAIGALTNPIAKIAAKMLEKWAYLNSDAIIALSPGMRKGVMATGFPRNRISVIPNSSDISEFRLPAATGETFRLKYDWMQDRPIVIYAGALGMMNDVGYLVDVAIASRAINSPALFVVAGSGFEENKIRERAAAANVLNDNFFMLGRLKKKDMPALFSAATISCSLFAPYKEMESNSSNKLFDTFAAGRPICINFGGWLKDIISDAGAGIVVSHDDPESAAQTINTLLHDRDKLILMSQNSAALADEKFSRELLAKKFIAQLEKVYADSLTKMQ